MSATVFTYTMLEFKKYKFNKYWSENLIIGLRNFSFLNELFVNLYHHDVSYLIKSLHGTVTAAVHTINDCGKPNMTDSHILGLKTGVVNDSTKINNDIK